jgi:hypothetical protein
MGSSWKVADFSMNQLAERKRSCQKVVEELLLLIR